MKRFFFCWMMVFVLMTGGGKASAHALEPGYLDVQQMSETSWRAFWRKPDVKGRPMEINAVLPEGCAPQSGGQPSFDGSAWVSSWIAACDRGLEGGTVLIEGLSLMSTDVLVRVQDLDGRASTYRLTPDEASFVVPEAQTTFQVFLSYLQLGYEHILEGVDHLLFVFALLVLIRAPWRLFGAITAFTLAHSITLAAASLGAINLPAPPVEAVIALSIVFLAVEIISRQEGQERLSERYPWVVSFSFGLLHGLGFAGALSEIGLPAGDIPAALLAFNVGVELGQIVFVAAVLLVFAVLRRIWPAILTAATTARSPLQLCMGYAIGGMSTWWLVERLAGF